MLLADKFYLGEEQRYTFPEVVQFLLDAGSSVFDEDIIAYTALDTFMVTGVYFLYMLY